MTNAIVTGANGFIGHQLCKVLNENGNKIYAILHNKDSYNQDLKSLKNVMPVICDFEHIELLADLIHEQEVNVLYHLAWHGVSGEDRGNYHIQLHNVEKTLTLINAVAKMNCKRFVGIGSAAEYDSYEACETDNITPNIVSLYGTAKVATHHMTKILCQNLGIEHIWARIGNTYGYGDKSSNFINFASKLILSSEPANFTAGEQNYDFIYVTDVADALYLIGKRGKDKCSYYVGSGSPRKLKEYIIALRDILNPDKELFLGAIPYNGVYSPLSVFDTSKTYEDTGFRAKINFEDGVKMLPPPKFFSIRQVNSTSVSNYKHKNADMRIAVRCAA